jgi:hypothetical protein
MEARIRQLEAQCIFPIHAPPHRIGGLAIRQPFDILHHRHQGQAPRRDFHGTPATAVEIGKEVIVIERAELGTQVHIEIAFGKGSLDNGCRRLRHRWQRVRTPGHLSPPDRTTITLPDTRMEHLQEVEYTSVGQISAH